MKINTIKKTAIIKKEYTPAHCWICNEEIVLQRCHEKQYFAKFHCKKCFSRGFVHASKYKEYITTTYDKGEVKIDSYEAQNFGEIQIAALTECPICLGMSLRVKKCTRKLKQKGKRGRPRRVVGNAYFCNCKECRFTSFVNKGLGRYIYYHNY